MGGQPVRERLGGPAFEQVDRRAGLAVDQEGAVVLAAPEREVVDPEHPRDGRRRVRRGHDQAQQRLPARRDAEAAGQPGRRPLGQRDCDVQEHAAQRRGLPRVADGQARDLLGERPFFAGRVRAEEPADGQPDHYPVPADRGVSQPPRVTAVHPPRDRAAPGALGRLCPRPGQHEQQPGRDHDFTNDHPCQVRQEKPQINGTRARQAPVALRQ